MKNIVRVITDLGFIVNTNHKNYILSRIVVVTPDEGLTPTKDGGTCL